VCAFQLSRLLDCATNRECIEVLPVRTVSYGASVLEYDAYGSLAPRDLKWAFWSSISTVREQALKMFSVSTGTCSALVIICLLRLGQIFGLPPCLALSYARPALGERPSRSAAGEGGSAAGS
jgi:hypothetical protein